MTQADAERQQIVQEQARLRDNLARVPANSDLQRRYLATLDKQETELEAIAKRRADAEKGVEAPRALGASWRSSDNRPPAAHGHVSAFT